jgi:small subunit ribosomal protein S4e
MKRVAAPKMWYLGKLKGVYSTRPAPGPHKLRECIPLNVILQQRLKYALNRQDSLKICKDREGMIKVDGKVRREHRFPLGQMDVITIDKTNEHFRILLDTKGRFQPIRIDAKEASFKLCKVVKKYIGKNKVPYVVTHDGRSIRFPHPEISLMDTVKINLANGEIQSVIKSVNGATVYLTGGNNIGRIGILQSVEKHPGSYDIGHIKDTNGASFATRHSNIFIIGDGKNPAITIPRGEGLKVGIIEEKNNKQDEESEAEEVVEEEK